MISNNRRQFILATAASAIAPWSIAQSNYPLKTIRYVVPVAAGGGADMIARATCERLAKPWPCSPAWLALYRTSAAAECDPWR